MKLKLTRPKVQEITLEFLKDKHDHFIISSKELLRLINEQLPPLKRIIIKQLASCYTSTFYKRYLIFRRAVKNDSLYLFKKVIE